MKMTGHQIRRHMELRRLRAWDRTLFLAREEAKGVNMRKVHGNTTVEYIVATAGDIERELQRLELDIDKKERKLRSQIDETAPDTAALIEATKS